ncbi:MAG: type 1 glutamine amidotransferase [Chloroflexi bacterium]|nr:type 1 glutamine amidotransferase [Chloroflexota bacterium]
MQLRNKRIAVLVENEYEDLELWYPTIRMREEGADVVLVGTGSAESYQGKHGLPCKPEVAASQVSARDFDAVIVPGGYAPDRLRRYPAVLQLVREAYGQGKPVAAICHAAWVPISAGIMRGRTATCVSAIKDDVINAGATYVDQEVVVDGNLITSRTPADLPAFCRAIIASVAGAGERRAAHG